MRIVTTFIIILAVVMPGLAQAQDVDQDGAIHALTGPHRHHPHHWRQQVRIPRYMRHICRPGIALPPGTTRPGRSTNFIPAR